MVKVNLILKYDKLLRLFNTVDITQQVYPKLLTFTFFISFALPECGKFLCCFTLLFICHGVSLIPVYKYP